MKPTERKEVVDVLIESRISLTPKALQVISDAFGGWDPFKPLNLEELSYCVWAANPKARYSTWQEFITLIESGNFTVPPEIKNSHERLKLLQKGIEQGRRRR